jgi:NAD+ diphosphatase
MISAPLYCASEIDRAAHLRRDAKALAELRQAKESQVLPIWRGLNLVSAGDEPRVIALELQTVKDFGEPIFLGLLPNNAPLFACDISAQEAGESGPELIPGGLFASLRDVGLRLLPSEAGLLAYARAIIHWHSRHGFCAVCGALTQSEEGGHARRCVNPDCSAQHFPRTDPAVIMLVHDGKRCVLGRQKRFPPGMYSVLAGFVEPGESLEEAVRREAHEEAGIKVGPVSYLASQPWPFPASLMLGFEALAEPGQSVICDGTELEDASWFTADDIASFPEQGRFLPRRDSIARMLIENWLDAQRAISAMAVKT